MEQKIIVFWDKIFEAQLIKTLVRILYPFQKELTDHCIETYNELNIFLGSDGKIKSSFKDEFQKAKCIIILAEIKEAGSLRYALRGLDMIQAIRQSWISTPIIACSFLDLLRNASEDDPKHQLLFTPGVYTYRLPAADRNKSDLCQISPISKNLLKDINHYIFKKSGRIDELFHDIKNQLGFEDRQMVDSEYGRIMETVDDFFASISFLLPNTKKTELEEIKNEYYESIKGKYTAPGQKLYGFKSSIIELLEIKNEETQNIKFDLPWLVLYIEDNPMTSTWVEENFERLGIKCIAVSDGYDAIEILKKDYLGKLEYEGQILPPNSITVLISDWRLKYEDNKWQDLQGYDIINRVFLKLQNLTCFFVLTSKKGGIVKSVQEGSQAQIKWYAKEDVINSLNSFNLFTERIVEEGNKIYDEIICKPKSASWNKAQVSDSSVVFINALKDYYRIYRLSESYHDNEKYVSESALEFIRFAIDLKEKYNEHEDFSLIKPIATPFEFTQKLSHPPTDENGKINESMLQAFMNKLIGRRIILGLWLQARKPVDQKEINEKKFYDSEENNWSINEILFMLKTGTFLEETAKPILEKKPKEEGKKFNLESWINDSKKQLFNNHMNLSTNIDKLIPNYLLIEELNWINKYLDIPITRAKIDYYLALSILIDRSAFSIKEYAPNTIFDKLKEKHPNTFDVPYIEVKTKTEVENHIKAIKMAFISYAVIDWSKIKATIWKYIEKLKMDEAMAEVDLEDNLFKKLENLSK